MRCTCRRLASLQRQFATETSQVVLPIKPPRPLRPTASSLPDDFGKNQMQTLPRELAESLHEIITSFRAPVRYAIGYGSGVVQQATYSSNAAPMLDFILAVSHPSHWHDVNKAQYPSHYSMLSRVLGTTFIGWAQDKLGAGVWFNVDARVKGRRIKYGVVSVDTLCSDLLDWRTMYCAGRLQKPVAVLKDEPRVRLANQVNLTSALRTALLLMPEVFDERELYERITGLSYLGDPRMRLAENPHKVRNIVSQQQHLFQKLYRPLFPQKTLHLSASGRCVQDAHARTRSDIVRSLPVTLRDRIKADYEARYRINTALGKAEKADPAGEKEFWSKVVQDDQFSTTLSTQLTAIVGTAASRQSLKGILSVGPAKGARYVWPKIKKRFGG